MIAPWLICVFIATVAGFVAGAYWNAWTVACRLSDALNERPGAERYTRLFRAAGWRRVILPFRAVGKSNRVSIN